MNKKIFIVFVLLSISLILQWCWLSESEKKAREYVYYANGQWTLEAILYLDKAIKLDPNCEIAYYHRWQIYVTIASMGGQNANKILDQWCQDLSQASLLTFGGVPQIEELYFQYCAERLISKYNKKSCYPSDPYCDLDEHWLPQGLAEAAFDFN
jgi:hypothetical protein